MNDNTLLHRQIHPKWVQDARVTSQAFRPSEKDGDLLSTYDGDKITADLAWVHFTQQLECESYGVCSVSVGECAAVKLPTRSDPDYFPEHAVVDFAGVATNEQVRRARILSRNANDRGWQFRTADDEEEE